MSDAPWNPDISVGLALFGGWFAMQFENITRMLLTVSQYLTGGVLVLLLRWLWHRTNIWSEISAMVGSLVVAFLVDRVLGHHYGIWQSDDQFQYYGQRILTILVTTSFVWLIVTLLTKPVPDDKLIAFYRRVAPPGPGWARIRRLCGDDCPQPDATGRILLTWLAGSAGLFGLLIAIGYGVACRWGWCGAWIAVAAIGTAAYSRMFPSLSHFSESGDEEALPKS